MNIRDSETCGPDPRPIQRIDKGVTFRGRFRSNATNEIFIRGDYAVVRLSDGTTWTPAKGDADTWVLDVYGYEELPHALLLPYGSSEE